MNTLPNLISLILLGIFNKMQVFLYKERFIQLTLNSSSRLILVYTCLLAKILFTRVNFIRVVVKLRQRVLFTSENVYFSPGRNDVHSCIAAPGANSITVLAALEGRAVT